MPALQGKRRRQSNAASVSFAVKTRWIWLLVAQAGMPVLLKSKSQKRRPEASGTKSEKRRRWLDVMGYFFQVGYEELHFFVAGGVVWGAQDGRGVHCGHHVRS
jgi:hypothetical protein